MNEQKTVDPNLYTKEYFLTDNEGHREYLAGLDVTIHPKFKRALEIARPSEGDIVLDIGCGRGEVVYYCAARKAKALGIDYSTSAIALAKETIAKLPADLRQYASAEVANIVERDFKEKYTIIFMIEIVEHMYDWQLITAFKKIHNILKKDGKFIMMTPNYYYEKYLSPIKRIVNIPFNMIKWPMRIARGKYRPKSFSELLERIFKIRADRGELNKLVHVNITTPGKLKGMLKDFDISIRCEDPSKNILSLVTKRWWGRDIVIVAKPKP